MPYLTNCCYISYHITSKQVYKTVGLDANHNSSKRSIRHFFVIIVNDLNINQSPNTVHGNVENTSNFLEGGRIIEKLKWEVSNNNKAFP